MKYLTRENYNKANVILGRLGLFVVVAMTLVCIMSPWKTECRYGMSAREFPMGPLPDNSVNIDMAKPGMLGPMTVFEFDCDENAFTQWAVRKGYQLSEAQVGQGGERLVYGVAFCCGTSDVRKETVVGPGLRYFKKFSSDSFLEVYYDRHRGRGYFALATR